MAKEVELNIHIDKNGKVVVEPKGTSGKECLDLMKFLDKIPAQFQQLNLHFHLDSFVLYISLQY